MFVVEAVVVVEMKRHESITEKVGDDIEVAHQVRVSGVEDETVGVGGKRVHASSNGSGPRVGSAAGVLERDPRAARTDLGRHVV